MSQDKLELAVNILSLVKHIYPDAFIAGGYVRDLDNDREPKDLDIFTFHPPFEDACLKGSMERDEEYHADSRIDCVSCFNEFKVPVDVIHLGAVNSDQDEAIANFALGIQQAKFVIGLSAPEPFDDLIAPKPRWIVQGTEAYKRDKENKTLTICRCATEPETYGIAAKISKLTQEKYAGWSVVIPIEFLPWSKILLGGIAE